MSKLNLEEICKLGTLQPRFTIPPSKRSDFQDDLHKATRKISAEYRTTNEPYILSLEHREHSISPGIEMGIGTDNKKADVGRFKGKVKKTRCICPNCVRHVQKNSMEKGSQHICHICSKTYSQTSHLRAHLLAHEGNKPFACNWHLCTWRFYSSSDLKRHRLKHTGEKRFECEKCGKRYKRLDNLRAHLLVHEGNKPFVCDWPYCPFRFYRLTDLRRHRLTHTGEKRFKCEQCGKRFSRSDHFTKHLRTHMGHRQDKSHLLVHEGNKPFACDWPFCPWRFYRLADLRRHRLKHTGEKRFKCEQCGKRFNRFDRFTRHVRMHDTNQESKIERWSLQDFGKSNDASGSKIVQD